MSSQENPIVHDLVIQIVELINYFCEGTGTNTEISDRGFKLMTSMKEEEGTTKVKREKRTSKELLALLNKKFDGVQKIHD